MIFCKLQSIGQTTFTTHALTGCIGLAGCAATRVETSGAATRQPLCQANGEQLSALALATSSKPAPDRVVVVQVRELGPILRLRIAPVFVEGGTEVVLELKVLDVHTGSAIANLRTHWQNGRAFVIKGVKTLEQDMRAALGAALAPAASA